LAEPDAKTNWRQGIDCVKRFLKEYQIGEADEYGTPLVAPKLFVDYSCSNLVREFANYRAAEGTAGRNPREIAQGIDDHALDALRYGLVHLYELGARHHLADVMPTGLHYAATMPVAVGAAVSPAGGNNSDGGTYGVTDFMGVAPATGYFVAGKEF
jgi:hypothetical protein